MTDDQTLLAEYVQTGSDAAFRGLVIRYVDLVYSTALRLVGGDTHRAEDVAQAVFADLARMARALPKDVKLGGWLHRDTCFVASKLMRGERRRQSRERQAVEMNALQNDSGPDFSLVAPILDEAINELGEADRTAILLRFFEQQNFRSVGQALGSNEDAARMRVTRALDKLHDLLKRRGVTTSAATLSVVLSANIVQAAPVGLAAAISTAATLAGTTTAALATATKTIAMTTFQKTLITSVIVAGVATTLVIQYQSQVSLREQNQSLRKQIAQLQTDNENLSGRLAHADRSLVLKLPAPQMQTTAPSTPSEDLQATTLFAKLNGLRDGSARLTAEQIAPYLAANGRSAASLLAAYRTTRDPALLEEAMQKFPDDPQVAFEAAFRKDASPEDRRHWLEAFKKSDSDNALPNYLSAFDYFKAGQADLAVQELIAASGKQQFQDFTLNRMQDDEEAYLAAGYPMAEAKTIPAWQLLLPQLHQIKDLSQQMIDLANSYRQAGDQTSAQAALQMVANLGQRYGNSVVGETEVSRLVGLAVERNALNAMDPGSPYGEGGQAVKDRLDYLARQSAEIKRLAQQTEALLPMMTDQDWISYKDRWRVFGEEAAAKWLISKYGQK